MTVFSGNGLSGKGALVTGGSRGIGRAVVERLTAAGAQVVLSYRSDTAAAEEVAGRTGALAGRADRGSEADLARLFATAEERLPGVDILVNNAAETGQAPIADVTPELYERVFAVNVRAVFLAVQWAGRVMRDGGRIVNVSTLNTRMPASASALSQAANPPEALATVPSYTALQRLGRPEDVAAVVAFLAGPDGGWVTGESIRATGGLVL